MSKTMKTIPKLRFPEFRDAPEWEEKVVGDIGRVSMCKRVMKDETSEIGDIPFYKIGTFGKKADAYISKALYEDYIKKYPYPKKGDILISASGTIGRLVVFDGLPAYFQDSNIVWIDNDEKIVKNSFLLFFYTTIKWTTEDTTIARLYNDNLRSVHILVPSIKEQQKIAECLSSLDTLILAQSSKVEALKAHKKALMQQLFPVEGETTPRLRFPEFKNAPEWEDDILDNVAKFRRGSFPQPYGLPEWYDEVNGTPFIQVFDVNDDLKLKPTTKSKISKLGAKQSVFIPQGTLIVTIQGSIGRVAITQYDAYIDRTLLLFEEFLKPIDKLFFAYVIQNLFAIEKEKAPGGIIKTITKEVLSDFKIKLPSFDEQQKVAICLLSLDELITAQSAKVEALKTHKKALMQQLFPSNDKADK